MITDLNKFKYINVYAEGNKIKDIIKKANAVLITLYNNDTYLGHIEVEQLNDVIIKNGLSDLYVSFNGGAIWCDMIHISDTENQTIYYYTLKEDLFYEQEM